MRMKRYFVIFAGVLILMVFNGCGKSDTTTSSQPTLDTTVTPKAISFTTDGSSIAGSVYLEKMSSSNDEITLAVNVKGGVNVYGAALEIVYDGSKVKYVSSSASGSYLGSDLLFESRLFRGQEGILLVGISRQPEIAKTGVSGDGTLLVVVLKALATQANTDIGFNVTNSWLKSPDATNPDISGTVWIGGDLSYQ